MLAEVTSRAYRPIQPVVTFGSLGSGGSSLFQFFVADHQVDFGGRDIDADGVSLLNQGDLATGCRFRTYMADGGLAGSASLPSVIKADPCQLHAGQGAGGSQHFPHTGAALRPFVSDNNHVSGTVMPS